VPASNALRLTGRPRKSSRVQYRLRAESRAGGGPWLAKANRKPHRFAALASRRRCRRRDAAGPGGADQTSSCAASATPGGNGSSAPIILDDCWFSPGAQRRPAGRWACQVSCASLACPRGHGWTGYGRETARGRRRPALSPSVRLTPLLSVRRRRCTRNGCPSVWNMGVDEEDSLDARPGGITALQTSCLVW